MTLDARTHASRIRRAIIAVWLGLTVIIVVCYVLAVGWVAAGIVLIVSLPLLIRLATIVEISFHRHAYDSVTHEPSRTSEGHVRPAAAVLVPVIDRPSIDWTTVLEAVSASVANNPECPHVILLDLADADDEATADDAKRIALARQAVERENSSLESPISLYVRPRRWAPTEGRWMGWERKRGKIHDFLADLSRETPQVRLVAGERVRPQYVATLDEGNVLAEGAIKRMAAILSAPENAPEREGGRIVRGYGAVQPALRPRDRGRKIRSDRRFDIYDESIFVGQGLISVSAYNEVLREAIPAGTVLSHDKLEGYHLRTCRTSAQLILEAPDPSGWSHSVRQERWIRGDTQLLPWALGSTARGRTRLSRLQRYWMWEDLARWLAPLSAVLASACGASAGQDVLGGAVLALCPFLLYRAELIVNAADRSATAVRFGKLRVPGPSHSIRRLAETYSAASLTIVAMVSAFARMLSRRNQLDWTVAAATSSANESALQRRVALIWVALAVGTVTALLFSHQWIAAAVHLLLAFAPLVSTVNSRR